MTNFIKPPSNLSSEDARIRQAIILISGISVIANGILAVGTFAGSRGQALVYTTSGLSFLLILILTVAGFVRISRVLIPLIALAGVGYLNIIGNGLHDPIMIAYGGVAIVAALMLGELGTITFGLLSMLVVLGIGLAGRAGLLLHPPATLTELFVAPVAVFGVSMLLWIVIRQLNQSLQVSRINEQAQIQANTALTKLKNSLEQRVEERTAELEKAGAYSVRRARQFEAITQVSRAIASTRNLQELLPLITRVISEQFGFYHVGIFLNDVNNQYANLSAANSPGGEHMLARGHQLKIGEQGIVGYVTGTGEPRIALDVGEDAVFFNNPDLPDTRSEMALPLFIAGDITGALDVQSIEPNAFTPDDIDVLIILADQVSLAIQNTRLFEETRRSLNEAETMYRQYLRDTWAQLPQEQKLAGFRYSPSGVVPLKDSVIQDQAADKSKANGDGHRQEVSVPVVLRGEKIGNLSVHLPEQGRIRTDQMDLIRAVAERVALSIENARLFEETTKRAERERLVSDITTKIRSTNDPEEMIRTAMEELQQALGATRVEIIPQRSSTPSDQ